MEEIDSKIVDVQERLRGIEKEIGFSERRNFGNKPFERRPITFRNEGGRERNEGKDREWKRGEGADISAYGYVADRKRRRNPSGKEDEVEEDDEPRMKRSLQSTVVMPAIETKSREEKIQELAKTEKKEVANRNRRMFSNLLQGTLTGFKKTSDIERQRVKKQQEALLKVEKDIEHQKEQAKQEAEKARQEKLEQRRELEIEVRSLTRKKALIQYADTKKKQLSLLSNFIMTQTQPCIFFKPAIANMRSTELKRNTEKTIARLVELREKELERELEAPYQPNEEEEGLKSFVAKRKESVPAIEKEDELKEKKQENSEKNEENEKNGHEKKKSVSPKSSSKSSSSDEEKEEVKNVPLLD